MSLMLLLLVTSISCSKDENIPKVELLDHILSATVAFSYNDVNLQNFFQSPTKAYISGYFYFENDLADDVIFGLDIEWFEGINNPIHIEGGDWMAFVGITRTGTIWIPFGSPENLTGIPTVNNNWEIKNLGQSLESNTWYKMTIEADFGSRQFSTVRFEGNNLDSTINISDLPLQYPNYASFNLPSLTFYSHASRSKELASENKGSTKVYFDDIEGAILVDSNYQVIFSNGFENQQQIQEIQITSPVISLSEIQKNTWYYENEKAKLTLVSDIKRSGNNALECNADLRIY